MHSSANSHIYSVMTKFCGRKCNVLFHREVTFHLLFERITIGIE